MVKFGGKLLSRGSLLLMAPVCALAADVKAQSSTQYLWYDDPFQDKTQGDLLQYVKFSATKTDTTAAELRAACNGKFVSSDPGPMCATGGTRLNRSTTCWTNWTTAA